MNDYMNDYLLVIFQDNLRQLIKYNISYFFELLEYWCKSDNCNLEIAVDFILEDSDVLSDEFFDRFIEILDKYGKTEYALRCVRTRIETLKKERFEL